MIFNTFTVTFTGLQVSLNVHTPFPSLSSVSSPSPDRGPCLAFLSAPPTVRPHAFWTAPAASAGRSQTALCTEQTSLVLHTAGISCNSATLTICCSASWEIVKYRYLFPNGYTEKTIDLVWASTNCCSLNSFWVMQTDCLSWLWAQLFYHSVSRSVNSSTYCCLFLFVLSQVEY